MHPGQLRSPGTRRVVLELRQVQPSAVKVTPVCPQVRAPGEASCQAQAQRPTHQRIAPVEELLADGPEERHLFERTSIPRAGATLPGSCQ